MAGRRSNLESDDSMPRFGPATTPEAREHQLIAAATDLAERQILAGTASAQVISHYLKLGSTREKLEQERLANENDLLRAKIEALESQKNIEHLYADAIKAMKSYSGQEDSETTEDPNDDDYY